MSYQSSIHFDPTALLIIKNELDTRIQNVEVAVNTLVEEQSLPFGIEDTHSQLQQCVNVVHLIDMPQLAELFQDCADLMHLIMQQPNQIAHEQVTALSEGTSMLKRYIEFMCVREVKVSQFLLDTFNRLQLALAKPLSKEGFKIERMLRCIEPQFNIPPLQQVNISKHGHSLFKQALNALLSQHFSEQDLQALAQSMLHIGNAAQSTPSEQYWQLVSHGLHNTERMLWNDARLRALIQIERNIDNFLAHPDSFKANSADIADALSLCISQENALAEHIRQELNIGEDVLSDAQLEVTRKHLFGPDHETIYTVSRLMTDMLSSIRSHLENHYHRVTEQQVMEMQAQLQQLASLFTVLNLSEVAHDFNQKIQALNSADYLNDEQNSQQILDSIAKAFNAIGILERHHRSGRLHLAVNNLDISLDRLDDAHAALLQCSKQSLDFIYEQLQSYLQTPDQNLLTNLDQHFKELSGAALFLGSRPLQQALHASATFVAEVCAQQQTMQSKHIEALYDVIASIDGLIDNLKNQQPVLQSMFNLAQQSSQSFNRTVSI